MKLVIPEFIDVLPIKYLRQIEQLCDLTWYKDFPNDSKTIIERCKDAEILAVEWIDFPYKLVSINKNLKYIITCSAGYSHFPLKEAREKNVLIINCPTHNSLAVAEHAIALMFAVSRKIVESQTNIRKGQWKKSPYSFLGTELTGKVLGIIGYGNIGKKVGGIAKGFGMKSIYVNSKSSEKEMDKLVKNSDYISLNTPLTKELI